MGDEKETWKVKTLDEILQEKKRRRELEEKTVIKRQKNTNDREPKRDTPEEGELRDQRMEITIRNSPYVREDSTEDRGEEDESLAIKPPQQVARKDKTHHRKEEKRKDKRRHRSHSAEGGKHVRAKDKEKERDSDRQKRRWEEDKARRDWERQKRREQARAHSRRERDRLEQQERQRERDRKIREQQKEEREFKERERRVDDRHKERGSRREIPSHHRILSDEYDDKSKQAHRSRSPARGSRDRSEHSEPRKIPGEASKEERPDVQDLLADLQDISDVERKTSTAESSIASGSGSEEEEEEEGEDQSSSQSEEEEEEEEDEGESVSASGRSEQSDVSEEEQSEEDAEEERENGKHIPAVPESRFDHDSEETEEGREGDPTPQSQTHSRSPTPEENYIPESPPVSPVELKKELPKYLPALQGCRSVEEFQCLNRIEEGTYGVVYRAKDKKTDEIVALKRLKMEKEKEGFPITSLREINTILKAQHPNIVTVREIVVGSNMDKIYIVMNYVEHDLKSLMETMKQPFLPGEIKTLMLQLLRGVRHLHDNWILHRDLKTSNLLLSHKGILKIGDFGLAREYGSPLKQYTPVVVTLWYRSPELLLGAKEYSTAVDMWSVGCIFGELLTQKPLFPGKSEIDQINKIYKVNAIIWPSNLMLRGLRTDCPFSRFLTYCPGKRISADEALKHEYLRETPLPIDPSMFPTWPAKSEQQRVKRGTSPRPPEGGLGYSQLGDDDLKDTGFHLTTSNLGVSAVGPGFSLKF
uniref:Cyclin dependent kinase 11B n=1 Tax=Xiphophorus couchianus TaxID=32473 RepID=A0A3B5KXF9_9TELE